MLAIGFRFSVLYTPDLKVKEAYDNHEEHRQDTRKIE